MDHYVITISRKFGSLGHEIANCLGKELDVPVYDRSAVEAEVQSLGLEAKKRALLQLQAKDQESSREKQGGIFWWKKEQDTEEENQAKIMFESQAEVLRGFAEKSSCVILGRGGDEVFRHYPKCLNIYLFAPDNVRLENCVRMLHTDEDTARTLMRREDRAREAYRNKFCKQGSDPTHGRHLLIDTSVFGVSESTRMIREAAEYLFKL